MNGWLITLGAATTLLLSFVAGINFVASVNDAKPVMSSLVGSEGGSCAPIKSRQSMISTRTNKPGKNTILSRQTPRVAVAHHVNQHVWSEVDPVIPESTEGSHSAEAKPSIDDVGGLETTAAAIESALDNFIADELVTIQQDTESLKVQINSHVLFASGSSHLSKEGIPLLRSIADVLGVTDNEIHVEGFTDSQPISTAEYPSNWELSTARATKVVRLFADYDIQPARMVSVGYGEFRPIADNGTEEGRAKNRRVVVVVLARPS